MREYLACRAEKQIQLKGTFVCVAIKNGNEIGKSMLLKDVTDLTGKREISDHLWIHLPSYFIVPYEIHRGAFVSVSGTLVKYKKQNGKTSFTLDLISCKEETK